MTSRVSYKLPENLTISNVHNIQEKLEAIMGKKECDKVVLKAEGVQRADTAGLQLLLAFVNATKEGHIDLDWNKPSEKLCSAASMLGLEEALGITH